MNNYEKAVIDLAPCGVDCSRCASYENGDIVRLSCELKEKLINFENLAENMKDFMPIFKYYKEFSDILNHFSTGKCPGCRNSDKPKCQCSINGCSKKNNVNFCFQCKSYPCTPTTFNESIKKKWKENNDKMNAEGIDNFYIEEKSKSRY